MFSHLNPEQQRAVRATAGRVLILAGAGSGKTSVLTYRIAHLIGELNVPPEAILALTFTNKAAQEMKERVGKLLSRSSASKVTLCTFHSFCMQLLRKEIHRLGYTSNFTMYDEKEVKRLGKQLARDILEHDGDLPSLEKVFHSISQAKNKGVAPSTDANPFLIDLYDRLKSSMRAYNVVDFDSLLSLTVELLETHPDVLQRCQDRYRYIMIDEYQDTNPIQYRLAELIASRHNNLCVVGDDDQSIYGWRGAEIKNILEFPSTTLIKLEQNYRSTPIILEAANSVIAHNRERHDKRLWSSTDRGNPIVIFHAPTELEEAQSVVQRMIKLHREEQVPWGSMAILYRSNLLSRPFETALMQATWQKEGQWVRGIPFEVFGGTEFYERAEIKDLLSYLRLIANPRDQEALLRIINTPRRGISDQTLDTLTQWNRSQQIPLWTLLEEVASPLSSELKSQLSERALVSIRSFVHLIHSAQEKFKKPPFYATFSWLVDAIDYKQAIKEEVKSETMRAFKWENVTHCMELLSTYDAEMLEEPEESPSLAHFLSASALDQERPFESSRKQTQERVHLMTFHGAKGLEFTACYLVGLEDHIIPHEKSLLETSLEEERRLMYVAMTRAKKHLTLSMAKQRKKMGKEIATTPSRFLYEIPKELLSIHSFNTV